MGFGFWFDAPGTVKKLIREWQPKNCRTEKDFERSLVAWLESKLEGKDIAKQFGVGRVRSDVVIDKKVLVELKINLDSTAKLQRLLGQIQLYKEDWAKPVFLVLCGKHDANLVRKLQHAVKPYAESLLDEFSVDLTVK
jgi:hypothetical protein